MGCRQGMGQSRKRGSSGISLRSGRPKTRIWTRRSGAVDPLGTLDIATSGTGGTNICPTPSLGRPFRSEMPDDPRSSLRAASRGPPIDPLLVPNRPSPHRLGEVAVQAASPQAHPSALLGLLRSLSSYCPLGFLSLSLSLSCSVSFFISLLLFPFVGVEFRHSWLVVVVPAHTGGTLDAPGCTWAFSTPVATVARRRRKHCLARCVNSRRSELIVPEFRHVRGPTTRARNM